MASRAIINYAPSPPNTTPGSGKREPEKPEERLFKSQPSSHRNRCGSLEMNSRAVGGPSLRRASLKPRRYEAIFHHQPASSALLLSRGTSRRERLKRLNLEETSHPDNAQRSVQLKGGDAIV
ncbi:hypothetical protein CDAR_477591 [Caerostris darwini]|uniref:Uncharacterized protein n=1 Tax=Caerostris darwini TaxID=1538125 RepID=A0AAV4RRR9_9ARAC|nr:hypothetical protein CDAR_477591 [Caerostris darwini]